MDIKKLSDDKLASSQKTIRSVGEYGAMLDSLDGNSPETELLPFAAALCPASGNDGCGIYNAGHSLSRKEGYCRLDELNAACD